MDSANLRNPKSVLNEDVERFSERVHRIREMAAVRALSLGHLLEVFGPKGHVFLTLFLVLPFMQPIPIPGISSALGLAIAITGGLMFLGRPPWLPERMAKIEVSGSTLHRICTGVEKLMRRLERWVKPRGAHLFERHWFRRMSGVIVCFHAIILALPLPIPFSNFFPALVLFFFALGTLEEDLYVIFAGLVAVVMNAAFFTALVVVPYLSVKAFNAG